MTKTLLTWLSLLIIVGAQSALPRQDETWQPTELIEPPMPLIGGSPIYEIITTIQPPTVTPPVAGDSSGVIEKMGWKVQIFSSSDYFEAERIYNRAVNEFADQEVERLFNAPYYKIRVGNCATREAAETLLERALNLRYRTAWIVRTMVRVRETEFLY